MKNVIEFPDRSIIEQEAVKWLIRLDGDTPPTPQELQALKEWMARSPAHTEELESLGVFWSDLALTELNIPLAGTAMVTATVDKHATTGHGRLNTFRKRTLWAVATVVLGVALLLQQGLLPGRFPAEHVDTVNGLYTTAVGKQVSIPLSDGSIVHLNTNSQVNVDYREGARNIHLVQGEAHFEVARNKERPFRVYAGRGRVQAVGTSFTVYLRERDIEVLVTEGKVELAAQTPPAPPADEQRNAPSIPSGADDSNGPEYYLTLPVQQLGLLTAGQGATIVIAQQNGAAENGEGHQVKLMDADTLRRKDAWRRGLLLFTGDSLEEVVSEIGRYTPVSIEIVDPELKKIRIGGQFRVGDVDGMFDVLETNFGLNITQLGNNKVQISAAKKRQE